MLATGTLSAIVTYAVPGGRSPSRVELTYRTGADPTGATQFLVDAWNKASRSTHVEFQPIPGGAADQRQKMADLANSGEANVIGLDIVDVPYFRDRGFLVQQELEEIGGYFPNTLLAGKVKDADQPPCWAVPFNADAGMLYERVGVGAPSTNGEPTPTLDDVIRRLSPPGSHQFAAQLEPFSSASQEAFVVNVLEHALAQDPDILAEDGKPLYQAERWRLALLPLRTAIREGRVDVRSSEDDTRDTFKGRSLHYMRNWPGEYRELIQNKDADVLASRIRLNPLPMGILGGQSLAVVAKTSDHDRAMDFVRFMSSEAAQTVLLSFGLPASRVGPYNAAQLQATIPDLDQIRIAVERARPRPITPNYPRVSKAIADGIGRVVAATIAQPTDDPTTDLYSPFIDDLKKQMGG